MNKERSLEDKRGISAKHKLTIMLVGLLTISIIAVFLLTYTGAKKGLEGQIKNGEEQLMDNISDYVESWIDGHIQEIQALSILLEDKNTPGVDNKLKVMEGYFSLDESYEYYGSLEDGTYLDASGWLPPSDYNPKDRGWYMDAIDKDGIAVSDPYVDKETDDIVVSISQAIGNKEGVISLDFRMSHLDQALTNTNIGKDSYIIIADKDGNILLHPREEYLPRAGEVTSLEEINIKLTGDNNRDINRKVEDYDGVDRFFLSSDIDTLGWKLILARPTANLTSLPRDLLINNIIASLIILFISVVLISFIAKYSIEPAIDASKVITDISNMKLDIDRKTIDKHKDKDDEIGLLFRSIDSLIDNMIDVTQVLQDASAQLDSNFNDVLNKTRNLDGSSNNTFASVESLSAGLEELSATTATLESTSVTIEEGVQEFRNNVESGRHEALKISEHASEQEELFIKRSESFDSNLREISEELDASIAEARKIENIKDLTLLIDNIAEQINMVALNSLIEAARAGEHGAGFSVVADEIRSLADQTKELVIEINRDTEEIILAVNNLLRATSQAMEDIQKNISVSHEEIMALLAEYNEDGENYYRTMENMARTSDEMLSAIDGMLISLSEIGHVIDESTELSMNVTMETRDITDNTGELERANDKVKDLSDNLRDITSKIEI